MVSLACLVGASLGAAGADVLVTTAADENNGSLDPGLGSGTSLREVVFHSPAGSTVKFAAALDGQTVTLTLGQIVIGENLGIDASALASGINVSGNDDFRVFDVQAGRTVTMNRLKIVDGEIATDGGGIRNAGNLSLANCEFTSNEAGDGGGAIENSGTLALTACTLDGNTAGVGGGAIEHASGLLTPTNSTLARNTAQWGGAIDGDGTSTIRLYSCTLSANHASDKGGGIEETDQLRAGSQGQFDQHPARGEPAFEHRRFQRRLRGYCRAAEPFRPRKLRRAHSDPAAAGRVAGDRCRRRDRTEGRPARLGPGGRSEGGYRRGGDPGLVDRDHGRRLGAGIVGNWADSLGGGVYSSGSVTANDSETGGNSSDFFYGGIYSTQLSMARCTVSGNLSADNGGGIGCFSGDLTDCTISSNDSIGNGGGVLHGAGVLTMTQCTVARNHATYWGGGVRSRGVIRINCCTIHGNDASEEGGGIDIDPASQLTLQNSIVAENLCIAAPDIFGSIQTESGVNLLGSPTDSQAPSQGLSAARD